MNHQSRHIALALISLLYPVVGSDCALGAQSPSVEVRLELKDDLYNDVQGAPILLEVPSGPSYSLVTDALGQTSSVMLDGGGSVLVSLGETSTPLGIVLGQKHLMLVPTFGWSTSQSFAFNRLYHQPIALPRFVSSLNAYTTPEPHHDRWIIYGVEHANQVDFQAHVAEFLSTAEIEAYESYYQVDFGLNVDEKQLGLLIRSPEVDIGQFNLAASLDCEGHGLGQVPIARSFVVVQDQDPQQPPPTFTATVFEWDEEIAFFSLEGKLERGDNIVILSTTGTPGGDTLRLESDPPDLSVGNGQQAVLGPTDCVPDPPSPPPDWSCDPEDLQGDPCRWTSRLART